MIPILTVCPKPDSAFVSEPCTLIDGTCESQDGKQVVFNVHSIEEKGEMDCSKDYAKYSTNEMAEMALATWFPQSFLSASLGGCIISFMLLSFCKASILVHRGASINSIPAPFTTIS